MLSRPLNGAQRHQTRCRPQRFIKSVEHWQASSGGDPLTNSGGTVAVRDIEIHKVAGGVVVW